jgi:hypothetical protein
MTRRISIGVVIAVVAAVVASVAFGFWSSTGTASASATTQTFTAPGNPQATVSGGGSSVGVSWTAAKLSDGTTAATGYYVTRTNVATSATSNACGSPGSPLPGSTLSCTDPAAPAGSYTYAITALYHSWTARSASTGQVTVSAGSIALSPGTGNVGSSTAVSGSGFPASSSVTITYDGTTVASASAGTTGSFSGANFTIPASTAGGHTVTATVSGASASATFTVTPHITLSPATGVAGTTATITGTGFAASKTVTASFGGAAVTLSGGTTTAAGSFSAGYMVPNQAPGAKPVVATDASGDTDTASFTIPTPSITLAPTTGHVGDSVSVSGSNFPAGSSVGATLGGSSVSVGGTTTTSSTGSFSGATFTVPAATAGGKSVQFTASGQSASATFTVTPAITLTPASGFAGSSDSIAGTGFAANSTITATFGGAAVTLSGTTTTSASGSFSAATYAVPNQPLGSKSVIVTDGSTNSTTATFVLHQASFVIDAPPTTVTAGSSFNLALRAILDGATDATYTGNHALTIAGASNSPNGSTPTTPTSATFTNGGATVPITLVKAGSETLTIGDGLRSVTGSLGVNSAGVQLAWDRGCPATITKNATTTFTVGVPNDAFGNTFRRSGGLTVTISSTNASNFPITGSPLTITDGPANNAFSVAESGANKTTTLSMTVGSPFTAPPACVVNSSN